MSLNRVWNEFPRSGSCESTGGGRRWGSNLLRQVIQHSFFVIFAILSCLLMVRTLDPDFNKEYCDPAEFYWPYAKYSKTRRGPTILGLYESGFLDLRKYSGLLCINGPAFVYTQNSYQEFVKPEIQIFSHACFGFNRKDIKAYKQEFVALDLDINADFYGPKIFGVYLLAGEGDFRRFSFRWFRGPAFSYFINEGNSDYIAGASFGMVTNDGGKYGTDQFEKPPVPHTMCFTAKRNATAGSVFININAGDPPKFCYREEQSQKLEFDKSFRSNLVASDYIWRKCFDDLGPPEELVIQQIPKELPDFRMIDPKLVKQQGSPGRITQTKKKSDPVALSKLIPGKSPADKVTPDDVDEVVKPDTSNIIDKDIKKIVTAELKECEDLPIRPDPCGEDADEEEYCQILQRVLQLKETDWAGKSSDNTTTVPTYPLSNASWRKSVFDLLIRIYQDVCPQVSRGLAPAIVRIIEYFIERVANDPQTTPSNNTASNSNSTGQSKYYLLNPKIPESDKKQWHGLALQLKTCAERASKMPFYRTRDKPQEQVRLILEQKVFRLSQDPKSARDPNINQAEINDKMEDPRIRFPYRIWLPVGGKQFEIKEHVEVAEIDYNLDWAIDTFWKIFSTVMGYCLPHYTILVDTFKSLYTRFTEDILALIKEQWTQEDYAGDGSAYIFGNFEKIYSQIFGEFIHGVASRYIDSCMNGAYVYVGHPEFRPPRPLHVKQGQIRPPNDRPLNFFVERPVYTKNTSSHP